MSTAVPFAESAWVILWEGNWGHMVRRRVNGTGTGTDMGKSKSTTTGRYSGRRNNKGRVMAGTTGMPWMTALSPCTVFRTHGMRSSTSITHTVTPMRNNSSSNLGCARTTARIVEAVTLRVV